MKNRIRILRAEHNLSQASLAKKIQVSRQSINAIESGKYVPSTLLTLKMASVFDVEVSEIFSLEEEDWG
ncbi:MAG: helix-turn-helix transcriptional regulator [Flavobacteriaceae bacterium]|nr:helix-turn-helix transcriptional regulator [Flavobacteriaceae bacterium]